MTPQAPMASEFLRLLWGTTKGWAELAALEPKKGAYPSSYPFTYPDSLDSVVFAAGQHNKAGSHVYMGVTLKKEKWPRATGRTDPKTGEKIFEKRGTDENTLSSEVVWCEFDFQSDKEGHKGRTIPEATARTVLKDFAFKPSMIVKSGGGIQVYWLLKETATGDSLAIVRAVNSALVEHFTFKDDQGKKYGADPQCVDLARIFRIPGLLNYKYTPPRQVQVSWLKPEFRYDLAQLQEFLKVEAPKPPDPPGLGGFTLIPGGASPQTTADPPPSGSTSRMIPSLLIPPQNIPEIGKLFSEIWFEGHRHQMALGVAGMLAYSGIVLDSALAVIQVTSDLVQGDTKKRLQDVRDTYDKFLSGEEVTGAPTIEKMIDEEFPLSARAPAKKVLERIRRLLPRPPKPSSGNKGTPFRIGKIVKFDSRPARWSVTLVFEDESQEEVTVETSNFVVFKGFQMAAYEQIHIMLVGVKETAWRHMISEAGDPEIKETPKEAKPEGAIEAALEQFLEDAKETPDLGILKSFAGYDEKSRYFTFQALRGFMKELGLRIEDRITFQTLKFLGYTNDVKRFGPQKTQRVWIEYLNGKQPGNGNGNGNGHHSHTPEEASQPQQPEAIQDLFPQEETHDDQK